MPHNVANKHYVFIESGTMLITKLYGEPDWKNAVSEFCLWYEDSMLVASMLSMTDKKIMLPTDGCITWP